MGKHQQPMRSPPRIQPAWEAPEPEPPVVDDPPEDNPPKSIFGSLRSLLRRKAD
jgi:hypothetical protein